MCAPPPQVVQGHVQIAVRACVCVCDEGGELARKRDAQSVLLSKHELNPSTPSSGTANP